MGSTEQTEMLIGDSSPRCGLHARFGEREALAVVQAGMSFSSGHCSKKFRTIIRQQENADFLTIPAPSLLINPRVTGSWLARVVVACGAPRLTWE